MENQNNNQASAATSKTVYELREIGRKACHTEGSDHYKAGGIEPIQLYISKGIAEDFFICNIIKYATRYPKTRNLKDLQKAADYAVLMAGLHVLKDGPQSVSKVCFGKQANTNTVQTEKPTSSTSCANGTLGNPTADVHYLSLATDILRKSGFKNITAYMINAAGIVVQKLCSDVRLANGEAERWEKSALNNEAEIKRLQNENAMLEAEIKKLQDQQRSVTINYNGVKLSKNESIDEFTQRISDDLISANEAWNKRKQQIYERNYNSAFGANEAHSTSSNTCAEDDVYDPAKTDFPLHAEHNPNIPEF